MSVLGVGPLYQKNEHIIITLDGIVEKIADVRNWTRTMKLGVDKTDTNMIHWLV